MKLKWLEGVNDDQIPFVPQLDNREDTEYFQERYSFREKDDSDIISDMNASKTKNNSETDGADVAAFPSVSMSQLAVANVKAAQLARKKRAQSFVEPSGNLSTMKLQRVVSLDPKRAKDIHNLLDQDLINELNASKAFDL